MNSAKGWIAVAAILLLWGAGAWWLEDRTHALWQEWQKRRQLNARYEALAERYAEAVRKKGLDRVLRFVRRVGGQYESKGRGGRRIVKITLQRDALPRLLERIASAGLAPEKLSLKTAGRSVHLEMELAW